MRDEEMETVGPGKPLVEPPATQHLDTEARLPETLPAAATELAVPRNAQACLVNIYPPGPAMGQRHTLADKLLTLGRDEGCDLVVDDPAVSRRHAEIRPAIAGHYVADLKSTNGTFVNDRPVSLHKFADGDYLRLGSRIYRYLAGGNIEAEYHEEIHRLAILDGLTGAHNKRALAEFLDRELARSARHGRPLALILFDLDHFKAVNDRRGHLAGDYALRELAQCARAVVSRDQLLARYGGEEFAVVLPEADREQAVALAERLRGLVEQHPFTFDKQAFHLTISLGVVATQGEAALTSAELIRRADEKLYQAKHAGRNRVID